MVTSQINNDNAANNKRIAKNTLLLYIRLFITMAIGLFTSRVVLNTLGVSDYGVYNVVAGFVAMFSLLTGSLSAAISRFLTYHLGKGNMRKLQVVFSTSVTIMIMMAVLVIVLAELFGLWFLNSQLNIPDDRMEAANWVFHFAVLSFAINLISIPYNASIISHEKMDAYAYISILEVVLKLVIVYMLYVSPFDKLVTYAFLLLVVSVIIRFIYGIYCSRKFEECHYTFVFDKGLLNEMGSFAGWNLLGSGAYLFNTQGVNIVTNVFFGVTTNAARGIANQVEGIAKQFVTNFTTAINPQITKSYSIGDISYMHSLVCRGAKFSYLLMLFLVVPFMFETETIMRLWLNIYPPEAPLFLRLSLIGTMFDMLGNSTANAAWATGNIKRYYIVIGGVGSLVFPFSWIAFALGASAYSSYIIFAIIYIAVMFLKVYIIKDLISFPPRLFFTDVLKPVLLTTIVAFVLPCVFYFLIPESLFRTVIVVFTSLLSVGISCYLIGLSNSERNKIDKSIKARLSVVASKIIRR